MKHLLFLGCRFFRFTANFLLLHKQLLILKSNKHANVLPSYNWQLFQKNIFIQKNKCVTINDKNDTTLYHETANPKNLYIKPLLTISYKTGKKGQISLKKFAHLISENTMFLKLYRVLINS